MHPFLDVSKLTDEEIIERLGKAYLYMNYQVSLGHTPTVTSIKEVIQDLEDERHSRTQKSAEDEFKKKNPTDINAIDIGTVDKFDLEEFIRKSL